MPKKIKTKPDFVRRVMDQLTSGMLTGDEFCALAGKLDPEDRTRLVDQLLRAHSADVEALGLPGRGSTKNSRASKAVNRFWIQ